MTKEQKFFKALQDVFIGAKIEGQGGFINLMRIKSNYYSQIEKILKKDINDALIKYPKFRDELFDKLYSFFSRYFSENGSIYFNSTPFHNNIYEKVYTDERDVVLFWKTQMLYYVKTDRIFRSMPVEFDSFKFYFDASTIQTKKANEKRSLIFEFNEVKEDETIVFSVFYSEKGKKTKTDEILKALKKKSIKLNEEDLERAFRIFEKQSEVDFFINKNAKAFLQEQFKLWSYQYFWEGAKQWSADRVNELQILKDISFKIIDFISQFEDELVKIWNKPKFVKNSNYVITFDHIISASSLRAERSNPKDNIINKILSHKNINKQIKEWKELGFVDDKFSAKVILSDSEESKKLFKEESSLNPKYQFLPIDTKYFKDLEPEILSLFDDLDNSLDGWLIKSENYQALNTILSKFKEKVQTIYIDPPFNLDSSDQFLYRTNYKDSSWATLLENRLKLAKDWLNEKGSIFVRCDYNGNWIVRNLLNQTFGDENFRNEILVNRGKQRFGELNKYTIATDTVFYFIKEKVKSYFSAFKRERYKSEAKGTNMIMKGERFPRERKFIDPDRNEVILIPPDGKHWKFVQKKIDQMIEKGIIYLAKSRSGFDSGIKKLVDGKLIPVDYVPSFKFDSDKTIDSNWTDISGYSADWNFETENSEQMLQRILYTTSLEGELIFDFFLGSGTTTAVAHKLGRKWIGVEMGEHFYTVVLPRMKKVLFYDKSGISKEKDVKENYNEKNAGGFFKYYELEQYEEALARCKYEDNDLFSVPNRSPYEEYVFLKDEKLLDTLELDYKNNKVNVDLNKLYDNIDIAETLSNLTGKWIKKIKSEKSKVKGVVFEDGTEIDLENLDYKLIKPLIWWE